MTTHVLAPTVVQDCLHRLIKKPIHRLFPGYLCLHQQAALEGRTTGISFPYNDFFDDYFRIKGSDADKPYYVPFTQAENPSLESLWFNHNVAGTYAPSSIRPTAPLMEIAELEEGGRDSKWGLKDNHWKLARLHLCDGEQIPAESLAAFLFRDYGFVDDEPSAYTLIETFTSEFGYELGGEAFSHLYRTGDSKITEDDFEQHD